MDMKKQKGYIRSSRESLAYRTSRTPYAKREDLFPSSITSDRSSLFTYGVRLVP